MVLFMFAGVGLLNALFPYFVETPPWTTIIGLIVWAVLFSWSILMALPTIVIRRDCFECHLGFYIMEHERNHLRLRGSELEVEQETLRQVGDRLIPILLSNPDMCKDCLFWFRRIFFQAASDYQARVP
jgi:hypothetical protein